MQPGQQVGSPSPCRLLTLRPLLGLYPGLTRIFMAVLRIREFIETDSSENPLRVYYVLR